MATQIPPGDEPAPEGAPVNVSGTAPSAVTARAPAVAPTPTPTAPGDTALKLEEFLPYRLNVVASLSSQALSRLYAKRYGIGVPEWRVLVTLGQYGEMTGKAVGAHSHMHKTKVSRAVALLEHRQLIGRRANDADMRESLLSLTDKGRAVYDDLVPIAVEFGRRLGEVIDPADRAAFDRALRKLTDRSTELAAEVALHRTDT